MSRRLTDFITGYLKYCEGTEPPVQYHLWCAISGIAAALQRKVYLKWGIETIYPNLYVVLIGPSGNRKGVSMSIIRDLVKSVGIKCTAESITREALIRDLRESISYYKDSDGTIRFHCSLTAFSEELSIFLGQNDVKFLADLTSWYNCESEWTYRTKQQGTDKIQGVYFNLLGATATDWLVSILPREAVGGGFTARVIFVVEEERHNVIALPPQPDEKLREDLLHDLEQIHIMSGEFVFTKDAVEIYRVFYEGSKNSNYGVSDRRFASYNERRGTHIRKLSMIMSASRSDDMIVDACDVDRAIKILEKTEVKMPRVFKGLGRSAYSDIIVEVFDYITKFEEVTSADIMTKFYPDIDDYTMDIVTKTLLSMRVIDVTVNTKTGDKVYKLIRKI